jgi:uncharacterized protein (DUF885 family)
MRISIFVALTIFSIVTMATTESPFSETGRLNNWLDARYEEELHFSPMKLAALGRKDLYDQIDDFSEAAELAKYYWRKQTVEQLKQQFAYDKLSPEGRISYDYWIYRLKLKKDELPFLNHWYLFSQMNGVHTELPQFLINIHAVETEQDMLDYIKRLNGISRGLNQSLVRAQKAAKEGIRPPRFAYQAVIEESTRVISGAPFAENSAVDSPLWADANAKIESLVEMGLISNTKAATLRQATSAALRSALLPVYQSLIAWLREDISNIDKEPKGVRALPNGKDYYRTILRYFTTTDMTAEEIHLLGVEEVARIRGEMEVIKEEVGFEGSLEAFFEFVRHDEQFFFTNDNAGRQAYIDESEQHLDWINTRLPRYFGILPQAELVVERVKPYLEQNGGAAFYKGSTADGSRPGTYYLHLSDMSALNTTQLESIAYHEGNPGHHLQSAIALERRELPLFRTAIWHSAYGEGWALYAEYLAREMGAFDSPYSDFGRLVMEMWRAIRLVVDTGIHAQGWSEQQAVDYMLSNTSTPEAMVRFEIRRYFVYPGQATSYKVGMLNLLELRERARKALGENYDIRGFHDAVLGGGSLPLPILERRVNNWIASGT